MADWRTPRQHDACSGTGRPFEEGERIYSALLAGDEGLRRADFSAAYFLDREEELGAIAWWATIHRTEERRGLALDFDTIEQIFLALEGRTEERVREVRYLMCLLLLRKRRLKVVRVVRAGDYEAMVVRRPRREETYEVQVFDLTPERAQALSGELQGLFESGDPGELSLGSESGPAEAEEGGDGAEVPSEPAGASEPAEEVPAEAPEGARPRA